MKSLKLYKVLDLEGDIPASIEDIPASRRARNTGLMTFEQYLRFLESFPPASHDALRASNGLSGPAPFEL
ncbi:MAG: hypothetical protein H6Q05_3339 [Acidobacteria bacterium]|nr:hypothetical protein [Acidobacteriota bacterium]